MTNRYILPEPLATAYGQLCAQIVAEGGRSLATNNPQDMRLVADAFGKLQAHIHDVLIHQQGKLNAKAFGK